jgi:hypothetical protein
VHRVPADWTELDAFADAPGPANQKFARAIELRITVLARYSGGEAADDSRTSAANPLTPTTGLAFVLHIGAGSTGLLSGMVAIASPKGKRIHRGAGTIFFIRC